jgi:hypothetical protein
MLASRRTKRSRRPRPLSLGQQGGARPPSQWLAFGPRSALSTIVDQGYLPTAARQLVILARLWPSAAMPAAFYLVRQATPSISSATRSAIEASAASPPCAAVSRSLATASQCGRLRYGLGRRHEHAHVGECCQRHHVQNDERLRKWPGPACAAYRLTWHLTANDFSPGRSCM